MRCAGSLASPRLHETTAEGGVVLTVSEEVLGTSPTAFYDRFERGASVIACQPLGGVMNVAMAPPVTPRRLRPSRLDGGEHCE